MQTAKGVSMVWADSRPKTTRPKACRLDTAGFRSSEVASWPTYSIRGESGGGGQRSGVESGGKICPAGLAQPASTTTPQPKSRRARRWKSRIIIEHL